MSQTSMSTSETHTAQLSLSAAEMALVQLDRQVCAAGLYAALDHIDLARREIATYRKEVRELGRKLSEHRRKGQETRNELALVRAVLAEAQEELEARRAAAACR